MSKRCEIVEMAQMMCPHFENGKRVASPTLFGENDRCDMNCEYSGLAEKLYSAGYRKQRKSRWIDCADGSAYCMRCGRAQRERTKCCSYCGAEMSGK